MARPYTALVRSGLRQPKPKSTHTKTTMRPGLVRLRLWTASEIYRTIAFPDEAVGCPRCECPKSNDRTKPNIRIGTCQGCRCHKNQEVR